MIKVLGVCQGNFYDYRFGQIGNMLIEKGFSFDILCNKNTYQEDWSVGNIFETSSSINILRRIYQRLLYIFLQNSTRYNPHFLCDFKKFIQNSHYNVVHWKDIMGFIDAYKICKKYNKKIILDMTENIPYNLWSTESDSNTQHWQYNLNAWFRYERLACQYADAILVNIEEMAQRLIGMHKISRDKIHVIHHVEKETIWNNIPFDKSIRDSLPNKKIFLYVGGCSIHRGLDVLIRAFNDSNTLRNEAHLIIIGNQGKGITLWKKLADELNLKSHVTFCGYMQPSVAHKYYKIADFGVIPHYKYGQTDNTVPHKLAQNLISELPVLVSSCHCLQRFVRENNVGMDFEAGCHKNAAKVMEKMLTSKEIDIWKKNCKKISTGKGFYSWETVSEKLISVYNDIKPN